MIHHTPDTQQSFSSLAPLAKAGGKLYIWIYSKEITSPYRLARKLLRKSYLLPQPALYALAWTLALPLHAANKIREACGQRKFTMVSQRLRTLSTTPSRRNLCIPIRAVKLRSGSDRNGLLRKKVSQKERSS